MRILPVSDNTPNSKGKLIQTSALENYVKRMSPERRNIFNNSLKQFEAEDNRVLKYSHNIVKKGNTKLLFGTFKDDKDSVLYEGIIGEESFGELLPSKMREDTLFDYYVFKKEVCPTRKLLLYKYTGQYDISDFIKDSFISYL